MKSSPEPVTALNDTGWQNWSPTSFDPKGMERPSTLADEAMAIFSLSEASVPAFTTGNGRVSTVESGPSWDPEEISWAPPFKAQSWGRWEGMAEPTRRPSFAQVEADKFTDEALGVLANARTRADELVFNAQQTRDNLLDEAQREIEQATAQGYQQGWAKAQAEAASLLEAVEQMAAEVKAWRENAISSSEPEVLGMIRQMAAVLFGDGIVLDEAALLANLSRIMEQTKSLGNLRVYLNPVDANRLEPAWKETKSLMLGSAFKIIMSDDIKPGGCFIDGESGSLDARVETQLEAVLGVFDQADDTRGETE